MSFYSIIDKNSLLRLIDRGHRPKGVKIMNNYEAVLIFSPVLADETRNQQVETFKEIINQAGEVTSIDDWGKKKLAYEIKDHKDGYYYIVDFKAEADHIKEFERRMRISDSIIRYMVIRKED